MKRAGRIYSVPQRGLRTRRRQMPIVSVSRSPELLFSHDWQSFGLEAQNFSGRFGINIYNGSHVLMKGSRQFLFAFLVLQGLCVSAGFALTGALPRSRTAASLRPQAQVYGDARCFELGALSLSWNEGRRCRVWYRVFLWSHIIKF